MKRDDAREPQRAFKKVGVDGGSTTGTLTPFNSSLIVTMADSSNNAISLFDLPPDIVRIIISISGDPQRMRLISPTWNVLALEYSNRVTIDRAILHVGYPGGLSVQVMVNVDHVEHFGLDKWKRVGSSCCGQYVILDSPIQRAYTRTIRERKAEEVENERALSRVKKLFNFCSNIGQMHIENVDSESFDILSSCLGSIPIGTLYIFALPKHVEYVTKKAAELNAFNRTVYVR